jgi:hypothetical protein
MKKKDEICVVSTVWCQFPNCKAERDSFLEERCQIRTIWRYFMACTLPGFDSPTAHNWISALKRELEQMVNLDSYNSVI